MRAVWVCVAIKKVPVRLCLHPTKHVSACLQCLLKSVTVSPFPLSTKMPCRRPPSTPLSWPAKLTAQRTSMSTSASCVEFRGRACQQQFVHKFKAILLQLSTCGCSRRRIGKSATYAREVKWSRSDSCHAKKMFK